MTASIITIGDELLIGQTIDTNSAWIAQEFIKIGLDIKFRLAVADDKDEILNALDLCHKKSNIIIITGGLGPTSDDITKPTLCNYFKTELKLHKPTLDDVVQFFTERNRAILQSNKDQALLPANCIPLPNKVGTAPGMLFEKDERIYISLPGVPFEMKHLIKHQVVPELLKRFTFKPSLHETVFTAGLGESFIAERLSDFEKQLPKDISIAYLPSLGTVKIRLSATVSKNKEILLASKKKLVNLVQDILVSTEESNLEEVIFSLLHKSNKTLALAESCTGGYIAHKFTAISGASNIFAGSAVCYIENTKNSVLGVKKESLLHYTAISKEVAIEMAENSRIKYNADFSLSTTGFLEGDETYFYCAVSSPNKTIAKRFNLPYGRKINLQLATSLSLQLLFKFIKKELT